MTRLSLLILALCTAPIASLKQLATNVRWNLDLLTAGVTPTRLNVDVEVKSNSKGRGLYAMRTLEKGSLIGRYTGVVISGEEFEANDSKGFCAFPPVLMPSMAIHHSRLCAHNR